ncbi:hypothetical protein [Amycolatopsis sp. FDAARGOS 1241]|uniref:hypothetical protein n=1 Tax=Amycolatopsis sp. FDAARGOS 1241 TaxID=2778070 RepID=UPI00194FAE4D|nr:hypothetical protein [Amycolatopsis sp. FDAARGOS 1241]QRP48873.1 hypothetical protein I6J71_14285 [Amycolatopsis sp. FDAARGOS 1241]
MPDNYLHVVGRTSNGGVFHTIRSPFGWTKPFDNVLTQAGVDPALNGAVDVACARRTPTDIAPLEGLYVFLATSAGLPLLLWRDEHFGTWFTGNQNQQPTFSRPRRVAAAVNRSWPEKGQQGYVDLDLAAVTDNGSLFAEFRDESPAGGQVFGAPNRVKPTVSFRSVDVSGSSKIDSRVVQLVGASADGRMHWSHGQGGTWDPFTLVDDPAAAGDLTAHGGIIDVAVNSSPSGLHFLCVTGDGHVWLATQTGTATGTSWTKWKDLELSTYLGLPAVEFDVGTFNSVAAATTSEGLHIVGTTTNGHLWHQLRSEPLSRFRDVELVGLGQDVGHFTAVDCAGLGPE